MAYTIRDTSNQHSMDELMDGARITGITEHGLLLRWLVEPVHIGRKAPWCKNVRREYIEAG